MTARFSEVLRRKLDPVWDAQNRHPFVAELGAGTLDTTRFQTWLAQDYLFLIEYARVFGLAAVRCHDLESTKWMIGVANGVLHQEMLLHEAYAIEFGLQREDLARGAKLPTTLAYSNHLLRTASLGSYRELLAALLPCLWGRSEIGQRLAQQERSSESRYNRWIGRYSGPVATDLVRRCRSMLDRLAAEAGPTQIAAEEAFATSSRYELLFWEMCYHGERWPA